MKLRTIRNFSVFLHNCDAIQDAQCIHIYKDALHIMAELCWRLDARDFKWKDETEKRRRLEGIVRYLLGEGLARVDDENGRLVSARAGGGCEEA